jgi:hypothetical protein
VLPNFTASGKSNKRDFVHYCPKNQIPLLYLHVALESANNPELTSYCLEGNALEGGLDTAENAARGSSVKRQKKKERQSAVRHQQDVLTFMKERNPADVMDSRVTMIKDLNISLSVLNTCWQDMDKTVMTLEDAEDIDTNPRKKGRLLSYQSKIRDNETESDAIKEKIRQIREKDEKVRPVQDGVVLDTVLDTTMDASLDMSLNTDHDDSGYVAADYLFNQEEPFRGYRGENFI